MSFALPLYLLTFDKAENAAVLITLIPGRHGVSRLPKVKFIAVLPTMDVKTVNSTLELLERHTDCEFTREWLKIQFTVITASFTTEDEWIIVKYVMEVLRPFRYWTLWM
jgi:hypothetical protein